MSIQAIINYDVPGNYSFDPIKIVVTSGAASLTATGPVAMPHPTDNPVIETNTKFQVDALTGFTENSGIPLGTSIKHILNVNSQNKWFDGLIWTNSDGSFLQANFASEITSNASTLDLSEGVFFKVLSLLNSSDGVNTPTLSDISIFYDFSAVVPTLINECVITGFLKDFTNEPIKGFIEVPGPVLPQFGTVRVFSERPFFHGTNLISVNVSESLLADGSFSISVIETETINQKVFVELNFKEDGLDRQKVFRNITIPDKPSEALSNLVIPA